MSLIKREIAQITSTKYIPKVDKYIAKLTFAHNDITAFGIRGRKGKEFWMSERQLDLLEYHLRKKQNKSSIGNINVYGNFDQKDGRLFYRYSEIEYEEPEERVFRPVPEQDLTDLIDEN